MRVAIAYPPLESEKGVPLLGQNRQFQFFNKPTYIYPMVPASAASNLKAHGSTVFWLDGIAEKWTYDEWERRLFDCDPDILVMETKCPVIKRHWRMIDDLRRKLPSLHIALVGDHVTHLPLESFDNSRVDMVITGGDYDFLLPEIVRSLEEDSPLPKGLYFRPDRGLNRSGAVETATPGGRTVLTTGPAELNHDLDSLPFIDRDLTRWELYAYENGNFKFTPGTYTYSGRDCWWGRCTFCIWDNVLNPYGTYRSFSPERLFAEIRHIVDNYPVKEIFDDSGSMMAGERMKRFCRLMIDSGYNRKVTLGCNMRFDGMDEEGYALMKEANFRFVLFGLESGNQKTLDRIDKGLTIEQIEKGARACKKAGLMPHVTLMLGYPWETREDAQRSVDFARHLFRKGYIDTLQATVCIPYPGTKLHRECLEQGWLLTEDYEEYDMRRPVMRSPLTEAEILDFTRQIYRSFLSPAFVLRKILSIRSWADFRFLFVAGLRVLGHLTDFKGEKKDGCQDCRK